MTKRTMDWARNSISTKGEPLAIGKKSVCDLEHQRGHIRRLLDMGRPEGDETPCPWDNRASSSRGRR